MGCLIIRSFIKYCIDEIWLKVLNIGKEIKSIEKEAFAHMTEVMMIKGEN
jgi:hypothetical protein